MSSFVGVMWSSFGVGDSGWVGSSMVVIDNNVSDVALLCSGGSRVTLNVDFGCKDGRGRHRVPFTGVRYRQLNVGRVAVSLKFVRRCFGDSLLRNTSTVPRKRCTSSGVGSAIIPFHGNVVLDVTVNVTRDGGLGGILVTGRNNSRAVCPSYHPRFVGTVSRTTRTNAFMSIHIITPCAGVAGNRVTTVNGGLNVSCTRA